jgi:hypothetical protein
MQTCIKYSKIASACYANLMFFYNEREREYESENNNERERF